MTAARLDSVLAAVTRHFILGVLGVTAVRLDSVLAANAARLDSILGLQLPAVVTGLDPILGIATPSPSTLVHLLYSFRLHFSSFTLLVWLLSGVAFYPSSLALYRDCGCAHIRWNYSV